MLNFRKKDVRPLNSSLSVSEILKTNTLIKMEIETLELNFSLGNFSEHHIDDDHFSGLYNDPLTKCTFVLCLFLGFCSVPGMILVIWFERSGQAGHFRTMINQLTSATLDQV